MHTWTVLDHVPTLEPKLPGVGLRSLGVVLPGIRSTTSQIKPFTKWWSDQNQTALAASGPLLVVIGDSTAIGIGASAPDRGYVGLLRDALSERDGLPWRVVNLAQSGAKTTDGLERQLPPGHILTLEPGESITLNPGDWHAFWGQGGDVLIGEVSTVNDDMTDNVFRDPIGRFAEIEEDVDPTHLLVSDYDHWFETASP